MEKLSFEAVERLIYENRSSAQQAIMAQQEKAMQKAERRDEEVRRFKEDQKQIMIEKERQAREKQEAVVNGEQGRPTESEIISLDTGLRLDGLPALELWDLIVSVFGSVSRVSDRSGQPDHNVNKHHKSQKRINKMENIDSVPSNVQSSRQEAVLYVFENNEAVIKMIIKGRSPTMRHVPGLTELHLIGCLIEFFWSPKSISNTSTPKTNSLTFKPKEVSRVMSGIIVLLV